jgi:hypothetical protein
MSFPSKYALSQGGHPAGLRITTSASNPSRSISSALTEMVRGAPSGKQTYERSSSARA